MQVNMYEAKTHLSALVNRVAVGEEVIIARNGKPVAKIVPVEQKRPAWMGMDEGKGWVADDFDAPLDDLIAAFEGHDEEGE